MALPITFPVSYHKINFVAIKDVHAAAVPPGRRRGRYGEEILAKLSWAGGLAEQVKGNVICAGDLFHIKSPTSPSNALAYVTRLMALIGAYPNNRMFGVVGNHDITADNLETLPEQPLGNLVEAGVYWPLGRVSVIFETPEGLRVRVDGYNYEADGRVNLEAMQTAQPDPTCQYRMAVIHSFGIEGKTDHFFGETAIGFDDLRTAPYDVFLWGHDHKPKGIIQVGEQQHLYLGSLSRAALTADEADRPVTVALVSFSAEGIKVLEREAPVTPLELAFHTAALDVEKAGTREDVVAQRAATTQFLADLQGQAEAVESEDPKEVLLTLTDDQLVIKEICDACDLH